MAVTDIEVRITVPGIVQNMAIYFYPKFKKQTIAEISIELVLVDYFIHYSATPLKTFVLDRYSAARPLWFQ